MTVSQVHARPVDSLRGKGRHRGATLLITVLVAVAAATIAVATARIAIGSLSNEQRRVAVSRAGETAVNIRGRVEVALEQDPLSFYYQVLDDEAPRICLETGATVQPGQAWPAECGSHWSYDLAGVEAAALLSPPSPERGTLQVRVLVREQGQEFGLLNEYLNGGLRRPLIYAGGDLDLGDLVRGGGDLDLAAPVYSMGSLTVGQVDVAAAAILATESGFAVRPQQSGPVYATASQVEGLPTVYDIRNVYTAPYPAITLQSSIAGLAALACRDANPGNHGEFSSGLCLRPGGNVVDSSGETLVVPSGEALLIAPSATDPALLDIHVAAALPSPLPGEVCAGCSLAGIAVGPTHPGGTQFWGAKLGTFRLPASGVVHSGFTTFAGLCGAPASNGPCPQSGTFSKSFTLVVGEPSSPRDLFLSGPLTATGRARIGVLASGDLVVPYWATTAAGAVRFDVVAAALGASSTGLRSVPASGPVDPRPEVEITGGVLLADFSTDLDAFTAVALSGDGLIAVDPPPLLPAPAMRFERVAERRLSAAEIAQLSATAGTGG